ncbi:hypothetical protein [Bradyrhizobium sp. WSM3983]|uniref:hypothetical protein n=1 Tax=Bradyrhizobium sp. WSM3983 TaxID=1038867 RepID=UPI0018DD23CC|nr:hypothetical protein [Bradyrhizobium sp. WSM3983]
MKFGAGHPFADPEAEARKRSLAASSPINGPFLCDASRTSSGFRTGLTFAVERDWIKRHESGTHVKPAERGIEFQPVVEHETKRSRSRLLSLEPTDVLELIGRFRPIRQAKSIIDEHWKDDDHDGRQFGSHAHTSERHPAPPKTAENQAHRTRPAVRLQTPVGGRVGPRKLASGEFSNGVHRKPQADDVSLLAGTVVSIATHYAHRSAAMAPTAASSYIGYKYWSLFWMRGLVILFVAFVVMLAARGQHKIGFVPRPTASMPPVNVP